MHQLYALRKALPSPRKRPGRAGHGRGGPGQSSHPGRPEGKSSVFISDAEKEEAEEYIENCNPVNDVVWSNFLEVTPFGEEVEG